MKKIILPLCVACSCLLASDDSLKQEIEALKVQMAELKNAQSKINIDALKAQISEVKAHDANDNIKWSVDLRTSYDAIDYKIKGLADQDNGVWTNKLILGMAAQPADNLVFKGSLGVYSMFGNNSSTGMNPYSNMNWYSSESPDDNTIRLREAYFLYFGNMGDIPYTASFGRRPSVDGFLTNLRADNENPASPIGHNINMEFDGASFKFDLDKLTGVSGMYVKLCLGRGNSNADARYPTFTGYPIMGGVVPSSTQTPYVKTDSDSANMDLAGLIWQIYDNGQYKVMANYFKGWNMMGANFSVASEGALADNPMDMATLMDDTYNVSMTDVGDLTGGALSLQVNGIGDGISDFLDDSIFFASYAFSKTDPKGNHATVMDALYNNLGMSSSTQEMLGSSDKETGFSIYTGIQIPSFFEGHRLGLEYNHGSKYWRSFTYGEDTLVGSKLAARGDAYEIYYTLPLVGKNLTAQLSYLYIDYDYTGSDMFFGSTGTPQNVDETAGAVRSAQNVRASLRYRY
ncbi:DUF3373 family protein [Sulfurospirillum deleyianum]|uniref:DUF3373 domain-containing protein n=1 Tax=Sulfurospirillum deleyianum (strain ATCC 51133 / DSM 6946 / 5175) TaxID=525898 RepID=D1B5B1_SULD5|nr:DUF3373 family protein [Sulfurospirillum deleyianum]ACZ13281.1 conserved hypothetical protein [Sulfurospirillum deleyianum DSM 6946]